MGISHKTLALIVDTVRKILQDNQIFPECPGSLAPLSVSVPALLNYHEAKFYMIELEFFDSYFDDK